MSRHSPNRSNAIASDESIVAPLFEFIKLAANISLNDLAAVVGLSVSHFNVPFRGGFNLRIII
jgi:hypothetical protein